MAKTVADQFAERPELAMPAAFTVEAAKGFPLFIAMSPGIAALTVMPYSPTRARPTPAHRCACFGSSRGP